MAITLSDTQSMIIVALLGVMFLKTIMDIMSDAKLPTVKKLRQAHRKQKPLCLFHYPNGTCDFKILETTENGNQVKLDEEYGIVFAPKNPNLSEFLDSKIPIFHYLYSCSYPVTPKGVASANAVKSKLKEKMVNPTFEILATLLHRNIDKKSNEQVREEMIPESESRISDKELNAVRTASQELKQQKVQDGMIVFSEVKDFLMLVGMNTSQSLMELKSYIIAKERGHLDNSSMGLDFKKIAPFILVVLLVFYMMSTGSMPSF